MRWVEEIDGSCPTRGALISFAEILDTSDDPRRARSADWICRDCHRAVGMLYGLCGACWLHAWKAANP
jgi:hypothetical protein